MSIHSKLVTLFDMAECLIRRPGMTLRLWSKLPCTVRAFSYSQVWQSDVANQTAPLVPDSQTTTASTNPLEAFFHSHEKGRGIWKWLHYFDIYHHHFQRFVGREVHVLEIGVYSGGSLDMWRHYFGSKCRIYGVDIEEACKQYENEYAQVFIGDQADPRFWKAFKERVPTIDVLIDDGGHQTRQQIVTLEEMLPHLSPGGVYLCEDIHGEHNGFSALMQGIVANLNAKTSTGPESGVNPTHFQACIRSVHFYPYVTVIEKNEVPVRRFVAPRHGTEWQPFL